MKHGKKFLPLAVALTLIVALSGCITRFDIDLLLDPQYELNQVKVLAYMNPITWTATIIKAEHIEKEIKTGETYTHNMFDDPTHYSWVTRTLPSGTTDKIVCTFTAPHPGPGWEHTIELTIRDEGFQKATATITKSI